MPGRYPTPPPGIAKKNRPRKLRAVLLFHRSNWNKGKHHPLPQFENSESFLPRTIVKLTTDRLKMNHWGVSPMIHFQTAPDSQMEQASASRLSCYCPMLEWQRSISDRFDDSYSEERLHVKKNPISKRTTITCPAYDTRGTVDDLHLDRLGHVSAGDAPHG